MNLAIGIQMSRKWRTHYLLPDRGCLNVHEKNMEKNFQTKKSIIAKMIVQYKQRYTHTSLPCSVALVDLR
jgi:hypothetical protein